MIMLMVHDYMIMLMVQWLYDNVNGSMIIW